MNVTVVDRDGNPKVLKGKVGDNLLYLAHRYGIDMEGEVDLYYSSSSCGPLFYKQASLGTIASC